MKTFASIKKKWMKNAEFRKEYDALGPEFSLAEMLIRQRIEKGFTQRELARKIGTKQSAISRLESGSYNPTFAVLKKIAHALGSRLEVSIR